ncbi:MAG: hypothetical protein NTU49_01095 [Gammaproteobacteria bacterium]|nr:hypothetical protein [Gammaproteobacteria bacterium]
MLNNKSIITLSLLLGCATAMAGGMTAEPAQSSMAVKSYDGPYVGGNFDVTRVYMGANGPAGRLGGFGTTDYAGGAVLGYNMTLSGPFKLGMEAFGNDDQIKTTITTGASTYFNELQYNWGFRALPGYRFNDGLVAHLILGYTNAGFGTRASGIYGTYNSQFGANGFQTGLGVWMPVFHDIFVRLDGLYTIYGLQNLPGGYSNNLNTLTGSLTIGDKLSWLG